MPSYIQIKIENISSTESEILIAQLSEIGFDGFEEGENFLLGYIADDKLNEDQLKKIISSHQLTYSKNLIEQKNWNEEWEKNFEPIIVNDFVAIRAHFHQPVKNVEHEIIITPKMSFGTGHHATTYMMMQQMPSIDFKNKNVFDFGTGTGILAILAEKLGAAKITVVDSLIENGHLLVSGLLKEDETHILKTADILSLKNINTIYRDKWICVKFTH